METLWVSKPRSRLGLLLVLAVGCSGDGPTSPTAPENPAPPAVATITVTPSGPAMDVGQSQQLSATLRDAGGNVLVGRTITWTTSDDAIAMVDAAGLVQGRAPGQATITATSEGKTGTVNVTIRSAVAAVATITITPGSLTLTVGDAQRLSATLQDAAGNRLIGRPISWTSSDIVLATVDATGLVQGVNPGQVTITAASEGKTASAAVIVQGITVSGQKIAFNTDRNGNHEIYIMNPDGTGLVNLTRNPADDSRPTWSPDGSKIAFVSDRDGDEEIYSMNADGSNVVRLTHHPGFDGEPSWSGSRIVYTRDDRTFAEAYEVYVMNSDGTDPVNVTNNGDLAGGPSWSPDGMRIAFHSDRDFDVDFTELWEEIFVMNANGSNPVNVTNHDTAVDAYPEWSPDGTRIAFHRLLVTGSSSQPGEIWVMHADGANPVNLTNNPAGDYLPSWSPDGTKIVFASDRAGNNEIYIMNADGTGIQRLTSHPAADFWPAWRP